MTWHKTIFITRQEHLRGKKENCIRGSRSPGQIDCRYITDKNHIINRKLNHTTHSTNKN